MHCRIAGLMIHLWIIRVLLRLMVHWLLLHIGFTHGYGGWHLHFAHGGFLISLPLSFLLLLSFYFLKIVSFASPYAQKDARDEVHNPTEEAGDHPKEDDTAESLAIIRFCFFWVITFARENSTKNSKPEHKVQNIQSLYYRKSYGRSPSAALASLATE